MNEYERGREVGLVDGILFMGSRELASSCHKDNAPEIGRIAAQRGLVFHETGPEGADRVGYTISDGYAQPKPALRIVS